MSTGIYHDSNNNNNSASKVNSSDVSLVESILFGSKREMMMMMSMNMLLTPSTTAAKAVANTARWTGNPKSERKLLDYSLSVSNALSFVNDDDGYPMDKNNNMMVNDNRRSAVSKRNRNDLIGSTAIPTDSPFKVPQLSLERDDNLFNDEYQQLSKRYESLKAEFEQIQKVLFDIQNDLNKTRAEKKAMMSKVDEKQQIYDGLNQKIKQLEQEMEKMTIENQELRTSNETIQQENNELKQRNANILSTYDNMKFELEKQLENEKIKTKNAEDRLTILVTRGYFDEDDYPNTTFHNLSTSMDSTMTSSFFDQARN